MLIYKVSYVMLEIIPITARIFGFNVSSSKTVVIARRMVVTSADDDVLAGSAEDSQVASA